MLENELQYHGLAVRINNGDDGATSSKNLVKFCLVTDDRAYLRTSGKTRPKTGIYSQIFPDILERFSQSFHHMKALYMQMMDLYLIFQFF